MKKKILVIFMTVLLSVSAFSQEVQNAVFVDFGTTIIALLSGGFGIGAGYERGLTDNFSVIINGAYIGFTVTGVSDDLKYMGITAGLHGRYYPLGNAVAKWFIDAGGSYSHIEATYGEKAVSNIFEAAILTGWKYIFNGDSGFFLEPGLKYTLAFGDIKTPSGSPDTPAPGGLGFYLGLGWAF